MAIRAYTVKKEHGRYRYDRNSQTSEILGQSDVLAVLFFYFWGPYWERFSAIR